MKNIKHEMRMIRKYGNDILASDKFKDARKQIHHYRSTVASHSVQTAISGLRICRALRKFGIKVDMRSVVRTALLHDLGMIGRDDLYRNNYECCLRHPGNSAHISRQIWKGIDEKSVAAIKSHMWPLSLHVPKTREAFVLCMADKAASIKGLIKKTL